LCRGLIPHGLEAIGFDVPEQEMRDRRVKSQKMNFMTS